MKWIVKAITQKFISFLPFGFYINQFLKYLRGTEEEPADYYTNFFRIMILEDLINHFGIGYNSIKILELGSGWSVELPALAYAYGFHDYTMSDIAPLRRDRSVRAKLKTLPEAIKKAEQIYSTQYPFKIFTHQIFQENLLFLSRIQTYSEFQVKTKYKYLYPVGIDKINSSYDAIISINTLEHIPIEVIRRGIKTIFNSLKDGGISIHIIDHNDHFQYVDPKITRLNMHKFTNFQWSLITSKFNYTNRMTIDDYVNILNSEGIPGTLIPLEFYKDEVINNFLVKNPRIKKISPVALSKLIIKKI